MSTSQPEHVGPYRLIEKIGEGGMGVVHLAVSPDGGLAAVKVLRPWLVGGADARRRFEKEFAALRRVGGHRVAEVLDADVAGDLPYIATRYVRGSSLDKVVGDHGPLRGQALMRLAEGLAEAVAAVHDVDVVHRDIKPGNVMMTDNGPVLIDFGLARAVDETRLTATGLVIGTPGYLSPEVVDGEVPQPPSDVHGWAATVAFAATGRPPYGNGPAAVVLDRIRRGDIDIGEVEPGLAAILHHALVGDPAARPTIMDVRTMLAEPDAVATTAFGASAVNDAGSAQPDASATPAAAANGASAVPPGLGAAAAAEEQAAAQAEGAETQAAQAEDAETQAAQAEDGETRAALPRVSAAQQAGSAATPATQQHDAGPSTITSAPTTYAKRTRIQEVPLPAADREAPTAPGTATAPDHPRVQPGSPPSGAAPPGTASPNGAVPRQAKTRRPKPPATLWPDGIAPPLATWPARLVVVLGAAAIGILIGVLDGWGGLVVLFAALVTGRTTWRVRRSLYQRRVARGYQPRDNMAAVAGTPWYALISAIPSLVQVILLGALGYLIGTAVAVAQSQAPDIGQRTPFIVASLVIVVLAWVGPATSKVRHGIRALAAPLDRSTRAAWIAVGVTFAIVWILLLIWESYPTQWEVPGFIQSGIDELNRRL